MNVLNQIHTWLATRACGNCYRSRKVAHWNLGVFLWLICLIECTYEQPLEHSVRLSHNRLAMPLQPSLLVPEMHRLSTATNAHVSPFVVPNDLRPNVFDFIEEASIGVPSDENPRESGGAVSWPRRISEVDEHRSIKARFINPVKSPLSPRAILPSSVQSKNRHLSGPRPTSVSGLNAASHIVPHASHVNNNNNLCEQIECLERGQTFYSLPNANGDKADTIEDMYRRMPNKKHKIRQVSRRKLENYELPQSSAPNRTKATNSVNSTMPATISTRQTNDAMHSNRLANGTNRNYANESALQTNLTQNVFSTHVESNPYKEKKDFAFGAFVHEKENRSAGQQPETRMSNRNSVTVLGDGLQDNTNKAASDNDDSNQSDTNSHDDSGKPEEDWRINQYAGSVPHSRRGHAKKERQNVSSLVSSDYSNRDRGFGFIKAWAWDRAEKYRVKEGQHRDIARSKLKQ